MLKNKANHMVNTRLKWVYEDIKNTYGLTVKYIDIRERPDLVKKFRIKHLPDNFFVYKNKKGELIWVRVKAGLIAKDELFNNTIFLFNNIIENKDK
jgi:conjugal transfer pilus assembly protein TraF